MDVPTSTFMLRCLYHNPRRKAASHGWEFPALRALDAHVSDWPCKIRTEQSGVGVCCWGSMTRIILTQHDAHQPATPIAACQAKQQLFYLYSLSLSLFLSLLTQAGSLPRASSESGSSFTSSLTLTSSFTFTSSFTSAFTSAFTSGGLAKTSHSAGFLYSDNTGG